MRNYFLTIIIIFISIFIYPSTNNDLFTLQRKGGYYIDFLNSTRYTGNLHSAIDKTILELKNRNINLFLSQNDSIRYGTGYKRLLSRQNLFHYEAIDKSFWIDIKYCQSKEELNSTWQELRKRKWFYTGINYYDSKIGYTSNADSNSIIAIIKTKNIIFNIGLDLPIKETNKGFEKLTSMEQELILEKTVILNNIIKIIAQNFVNEEDQIFLPVTDRELNQSERLLGYFKFWTEVKYNFVFFDHVPNLNWDKILVEFLPAIQKEQTTLEYYKTLRKLCALLNDGHTNVYYPDYIDSQFDEPQVEVKNFQNKAYITNIAKSLNNKIEIGSEVREIEHIPIEKYLEENIFPYYSTSTSYIKWDWGIRDLFKGIKSSKINVKLKNLDDSEQTVELIRDASMSNDEWLINNNRNWKPFEYKWFDDSLAYISLNEFEDDAVVTGFENVMPELKKAKGLIIDLRKNNGGNTEIGSRIIEYLTSNMFLTSKWKTRDMRSSFRAWGQYYSDFSNEEINKLDKVEKEQAVESIKTLSGNNWYEGKPDTVKPKRGEKLNQPIVVLIGHTTASAAEDFLVSMDYLNRAIFVGENSFGSTGQPFLFKLPGGGSARVCTKRDSYPDGREFVGFGVKPNVYVQQTIQDYLNDYDPVLEKGKEILKSKF